MSDLNASIELLGAGYESLHRNRGYMDARLDPAVFHLAGLFVVEIGLIRLVSADLESRQSVRHLCQGHSPRTVHLCSGF